MNPQHDHRGRALSSTVTTLAVVLLIITLMPRTDPSQWGAVLAVGALGPVAGLVLAILSAVALGRAAERSTKTTARVGIGLAIVSIISALSLFAL